MPVVHAALLLLAFAPSTAAVPPLQTPAPTSSAATEGVPAPTEAAPTPEPAVPEAAPTSPEPAVPEASPAPAEASPAPVETTPMPAPTDAASDAPAAVPAPEPIVDAELPPTWERVEASASQPNRRGIMLGLGLGFIGCETEECDYSDSTAGIRFRGGFAGQLELGYRFKWIAPVASAALGGGPSRFSGELSGLEGKMRFLDLGVGLFVFPVGRGRLDPYLGAQIGYARAHSSFSVPGVPVSGIRTYARAGGRLTAGLDVRLGAYAALGPRLDLTLPFGGTLCDVIREDSVPDEMCVNVEDLPDELRRELPRWWTASLQVRVVLPKLVGR